MPAWLPFSFPIPIETPTGNQSLRLRLRVKHLSPGFRETGRMSLWDIRGQSHLTYLMRREGKAFRLRSAEWDTTPAYVKSVRSNSSWGEVTSA